MHYVSCKADGFEATTEWKLADLNMAAKTAEISHHINQNNLEALSGFRRD